MHLLTLASCVPFIPLALAVDFCPPLGAVFPLPHSLSNNSLIITAAANLTARLDALWAGGNATARLFNSTTTSLSISFFSTHEPDPLFEYHHTAEVLNTTANGTRSIAGDTVYRIGSISKVVTVLALLLHEEKFDWRDPITKYVPELSTCANNKTTDDCTAVSGVTGVMWDQVTLGALAAQLAGVPRDCKEILSALPSSNILSGGVLHTDSLRDLRFILRDIHTATSMGSSWVSYLERIQYPDLRDR